MSDSGFSFNDWGVPDLTDPSWSDPGEYYSGSYTPMPSLPTVDPTAGGSTGSWGDWLKAIPLIGQVFSSTYNAVNHPTAPSAYQTPAPQAPVPGAQDYQSQQAYPNSGAAGAPTSASSGGMMTWLQNPANLPFIVIGGIGAVLLMNSGKR